MSNAENVALMMAEDEGKTIYRRLRDHSPPGVYTRKKPEELWNFDRFEYRAAPFNVCIYILVNPDIGCITHTAYKEGMDRLLVMEPETKIAGEVFYTYQ